MRTIARFLSDEEAPTAVEYALMVTAIAAVIVAVVFVIGAKTNNNFNGLASNTKFGGS